MFEFLFKYRPVVFEHGQFVFASARVIAIGLLVALVIAVPAIATYRRVSAKSTRQDRVVLALLRAAAFALILVCLFRPMMVLSAAVPRQNVLAVLIDDSRSMQIADRGTARGADVAKTFAATGPLMTALGEKFILRLFRFSANADRVTSLTEVTDAAPETRIGPALDRVHDDLTGTPVAGVVLVSDGADNARPAPGAPTLDDQLRALRARGMPVYTVGVGREAFARDIQVSRVEAPKTVLKGSALVVTVIVTQHGFKGSTVPLVVEDSGRVVSTQDVALGADGEMAPIRVHVPAATAGARLLTFKIPVQTGEMVQQNNAQSAVITVLDRRAKILYIEGEARSELKFVRSAVADDPNLQVVTLIRTAENKFLRMSVDDSLELVTGFPKSREELFKYRGIILGSVEASFFTVDQLHMLADFVSERGGGLLALGGRRALAEGGYAGTALADVLPMQLETPRAGESTFVELKVELSPTGARYAATQIAGSEAKSTERYKTLPPLSSVNTIGRAKAGAIVLLSGVPVNGGDRRPVMLWQRYGRGKAIAFPVQDAWLWKMQADVPVGDKAHETLWRQTLRWLVSDVPGQVDILTANEHVLPKEPVTLRAEVRDAIHVKMNDAQVVAHVVAPSGARKDVAMEWTVDRDGEYRASFTPEERGMYAVQVVATSNGKPVAGDTAYLRSDESQAEYFDAEMRAPLLRRIAGETGGRFYTLETAASLPKDVVYTKSGTTEIQRMDLWDMPAIFLVVVLLLGCEWAYRRARGLA
ncbi:MAG: hypothetical protein ABJD07_02485 [Gemmatimonadaceae bacterium]